MLKIRRCDVVLPSQVPWRDGVRYASITLGAKTGTKSKRPQAIIIRDDEKHKTLLHLLERLCAATSGEELLVPYSYERYRLALKKFEVQVGAFLEYTPHSPRAGWASESFAEGEPFVEIKEQGRWLADSSLRTYIDVISASDISVKIHEGGLGEAVRYCFQNILAYFPEGCF